MMTSREIKEALSKANIKQVDIALKFKTSPANVNQLFNHEPTKEGLPSLIRQYIADQIGQEYETVWG